MSDKPKLATPELRLIRTFIRTIHILSLAAVFAMAESQARWPSWRGPNGNGSIKTGKYPFKWNSTHVLRKVALPGKGTSTPIVWKKGIYLTVPDKGQDAVLASDFSGRRLWDTRLGPESPPKHRTLGSSGNASPVRDGKGLFVYFQSGDFAALEFDRAIRWRISLVDQFGKDQIFWDQGSSPIVTDKHVVMTRMHSASRGLPDSTRPPVKFAGGKRGTTRLRPKTTTATPLQLLFCTKATRRC